MSIERVVKKENQIFNNNNNNNNNKPVIRQNIRQWNCLQTDVNIYEIKNWNVMSKTELIGKVH